MAKPRAGNHLGKRESSAMPLLDDVAEAAERVRQVDDELSRAREQLRARIRAARDEGIPFAAIARAAKLSRERVRQIFAGR